MEKDMNYLQLVKDFHKCFDLPVGTEPKVISYKDAFKRVRLMEEELVEYMEAVSEGDIVKIADALGDLLYVAFGSAVEHGLPMHRVFYEIHVSNMTKKGGHKDAGGKFIKPETYKPVDLSWLLDHPGDTVVEEKKCYATQFHDKDSKDILWVWDFVDLEIGDKITLEDGTCCEIVYKEYSDHGEAVKYFI